MSNTARNVNTFDFRHCAYEEAWDGEFPYDSYCTAKVTDPSGKLIKVFRFGTDINCSGPSSADKARIWAENYFPPRTPLAQAREEMKERKPIFSNLPPQWNDESLDDLIKEGRRVLRFYVEQKPLSFETAVDIERIKKQRKWALKILTDEVYTMLMGMKLDYSSCLK
jgi:hypothetical protein